MRMEEGAGPTEGLRAPVFTGLRGRLIVLYSVLFFLILALILVTGFTGISGTRYQGRQGEYREQAFRTLSFVADMKKDWLLNWISERRFDVGVIAGSELVRTSVSRLSDALTPHTDWGFREPQTVNALRAHPAHRPLVSYLQQFGSLHAMYKSISLAEPRRGMIIASSDDDLVGKDASRYPVYRRALADRYAWVGDIVPEPGSGLPLLRFADVVTGEMGDVLAVVLVAVDVETIFNPVLHTGSGLGKTGEALLVDRNQILLVSLKYPLVDGSVAEPFQFRNPALPALLASSGREGTVEAVDYRGIPVLCAYRYVRIQQDIGWGMVVKVDRAEILEPMWTDLRSSIILGSIGLLCVVGFSVVAAGRIARPLLDLTRVALRFSEGDRTIRSGLRRRDEIGILSSTFDFMADRIESDYRSLVDREDRLRVSKGALEVRQRIQGAILKVANVLASSPSLDDLLSRTLDELLKQTGCHLGAIYLRDEAAPDRFNLGIAIGVDMGKGPLPRVVSMGEGSVGLAAMRREILFLEESSRDSGFVFSTVAGELLPHFIASAPLVHNEEVIGVLTLAGLQTESPELEEIIELSRNSLAIAISNAQSHARTTRLAEELQSSNEELQAANEELTVQSEELQAQAEELREQAVELEEKRAQLEEADRLKTEFLSNMSHELRTPLNSILALSQLMIRRCTGAEGSEDAECLQVIERNGKQLLALINDILDLARIESGRMPLNLATVSPRLVVERALETIRPLADAKNLALTVAMAEVPLMETDEERVLQILLNLLSNAVKFTDFGIIEVSVAESEGRVSLRVTDSGIGIEPRHLESIFDEFRQVDGSTTRRYQGTGLGLAIAKKLARMLGGDVIAESEPGRGSCFTLTLPVSRGQDVTGGSGLPDEKAPRFRQTVMAAGRADRACSSGRPDETLVLVVEDNEVAALQIASALEGRGYGVRRVSSGAEAVDLAGRCVPDAVVLDLMMPDMDGFAVLEALRGNPATRRVPVLVLTAKDVTAEEHERLRLSGTCRLVQKGSVNRDELLAIVAAVLESSDRTGKAPGSNDHEGPVDHTGNR